MHSTLLVSTYIGPHLGGGRKGVFLLLRYVFIIAASYLLLFHASAKGVQPIHGLMIAMALGSNIVLSLVSQQKLFAWYVEAPVLIADTLWVSWALNSTGAVGGEFFLLYFLVLFLALIGESLPLVILASVAVGLINVYLGWDATTDFSVLILRLCFFFTVALFYGHVLGQIKHERQRADRGFAWAHELQAKVEERTAELVRLYQEAIAASSAKSDFVASMSHELRTPLNIIIGYADMLCEHLSPLPDSAGRDMTTRIREAATSLLKMVNNMLDLGRLEAGKMPLECLPVRLDRFVSEAARRERQPPAPGVTLAWQVAPDLPVIETDAVKLQRVLDDLVGNAIKLTRRGSITVAVRNLPQRREVEFAVTDTGPGIDDEHLSRIFEPFHRLGADAGGTGVGLGLAIVRKQVHLLQGQISVESRLGVGTTFRVRLPHRLEPRGPEVSAIAAAVGEALSQSTAVATGQRPTQEGPMMTCHVNSRS